MLIVDIGHVYILYHASIHFKTNYLRKSKKKSDLSFMQCFFRQQSKFNFFLQLSFQIPIIKCSRNPSFKRGHVIYRCFLDCRIYATYITYEDFEGILHEAVMAPFTYLLTGTDDTKGRMSELQIFQRRLESGLSTRVCRHFRFQAQAVAFYIWIMKNIITEKRHTCQSLRKVSHKNNIFAHVAHLQVKALYTSGRNVTLI